MHLKMVNLYKTERQRKQPDCLKEKQTLRILVSVYAQKCFQNHVFSFMHGILLGE